MFSWENTLDLVASWKFGFKSGRMHSDGILLKEGIAESFRRNGREAERIEFIWMMLCSDSCMPWLGKMSQIDSDLRILCTVIVETLSGWDLFLKCVCMLSHLSCVLLFVTPWPVAHQAPLSLGFSRQEYWSGLPCPPPGDLPDPGIELVSLMSPALTGGFFTTSATWEALCFQGGLMF